MKGLSSEKLFIKVISANRDKSKQIKWIALFSINTLDNDNGSFAIKLGYQYS